MHERDVSVDRRVRVWNRLHSESASHQVLRVAIQSSNVFAAQVLDIPRGLALVGRHGTGKSTFLRLLEMAFGQESYANRYPDREGTWTREALWEAPDLTGVIDVTTLSPHGILERRVDLSMSQEERSELWGDLKEPPEPWHISALSVFSDLQFLFQEYPGVRGANLGELQHQYTAPELQVLSTILGRNYDELRSYAYVVDHLEGRDFIEPFVRGCVNGRPVETGSMGSGEVWVHYVLAHALRLDWPGPLLLDEPESFLSPRGHRPFVDEIARLSLARQQQVIVATHSEQVMSRFSLTAMRLAVETEDGTMLVAPSSQSQVRDALGYDSPLSLILVVEDRFAATVLTTSISQLAPGLLRSIEVVPAEGSDDARRAARVLSALRRLRCIAVLDGDERSTRGKGAGVRFLPGSRNPEEELLTAAGKHTDVLASELGRSVADVMAAIDRCSAIEHQYIPQTFARSLGHQEAVVIRAMVKCWLAADEALRQATELVSEFESIVFPLQETSHVVDS
ncbi:hypothetical protein [Georgenia wangjunii]|uniref:hypothetical protein n=1 Tax=Georgenia wangjunii TaxID=3117730 RepID=UPI002F26BE66